MRKATFLLCWLLVAPCSGARADDAVYGPDEKLAALRENADTAYNYIVRGTPALLTVAKSKAAPDAPAPVDLPLIGGVAVTLKESDADTLSKQEGAVQVWYIHEDLYPVYVRIIQALQATKASNSPPMLSNLSLGPPNSLMPMVYHANEPMNVATAAMANSGYLMVFAIGNYYTPDSPNPGVISPWCRPAWVICAGAASADAKTLYEKSSRGVPDDPHSWPTAVAYGIDVLGPWTTKRQKTEEQERHDEADPNFRKLSKDKQPLYTVMSGTSQAAAQVTRAAAQITYFLTELMARTKDPKEGDKLFQFTIPPERYAVISKLTRLTGTVGQTTKDGVEITYTLDMPWKMVKQLLIDTAIPMPGFTPDQVGAGFVDPNYIDKQFGEFGVSKIQIESQKVE